MCLYLTLLISPFFDCQLQSIRYILSGCNRWVRTDFAFLEAARQRLHHFVVIDAKEKGDRISLVASPIHDPVDRALVLAVSPPHEEVCDIDHDTAIDWADRDPDAVCR
jgi:hypothetical protein